MLHFQKTLGVFLGRVWRARERLSHCFEKFTLATVYIMKLQGEKDDSHRAREGVRQQFRI